MTKKTPIELNISINDDVIGFIEKIPGKSEIESYGEVRLPKGVVKNGYIKEPKVLLEKIQSIYSSFKIKAKSVRWVLNEQNAILREIEIDKGELQNQNVDQYIQSQVGKTIHFPFEYPIFNHFIKVANDDSIVVTLFIIDEQMINDYLDIFDKMKIKNIAYEVPMLALFRLYYADNEEDEGQKAAPSVTAQIAGGSPIPPVASSLAPIEGMELDSDYYEDGLEEGLMLVNLYDTILTITIFSKAHPVLSMMEDIDAPDQVCEILDQYVSRICSYYKYNRNAGRKAVSNIVCFNLSTIIRDKNLKAEMDQRVLGVPFEVFDLGTKSKYYKRLLPTGCYIPLAASFYRSAPAVHQEK